MQSSTSPGSSTQSTKSPGKRKRRRSSCWRRCSLRGFQAHLRYAANKPSKIREHYWWHRPKHWTETDWGVSIYIAQSGPVAETIPCESILGYLEVEVGLMPMDANCENKTTSKGVCQTHPVKGELILPDFLWQTCYFQEVPTATESRGPYFWTKTGYWTLE